MTGNLILCIEFHNVLILQLLVLPSSTISNSSSRLSSDLESHEGLSAVALSSFTVRFPTPHLFLHLTSPPITALHPSVLYSCASKANRMQAQRPARTLRAANVAPDKDVTVTNAPSKQSFSAAGVFKKPRLPIRKKAHVTPKKNTRASRIPAAASSSIQKPPSGSARSSSASPQRAGQSKKSDMHPLALAFKGASAISPLSSS